MRDDETRRDWLTLDNAARIYPSSLSAWSPDVYRLSATLREPIRVAVLAAALRTVFPRFPYFQVQLRRGLFWYYLQRDDLIPDLEPLRSVPVSVQPGTGGGGHLLRVQAREAMIAVDFSHVLTDGSGAIRFLGTLVTEYLRRRGVAVVDWSPFCDPAEPPAPGEFEDAYVRYYDRRLAGPPRQSPAYHLPGEPQPRSRVITGRVPVAGALGLARAQGVSLTTYLVAIYLHAVSLIHAAENGAGDGRQAVARLEVPVDMRRHFPSATMRNFSLFVAPEIDLGGEARSFEAIVQRVHHSLGLQVDARELGRQIARNVRAVRHPGLRLLPLFLKDALFAHVRRRYGETPYSGVLSNLGRIEVPAAIAPHVASFGVMLGPNPRMKKNCAVLSYRDDLCISFGSVVEDRDLERLFFGHLIRAGLPVAVGERSGGP
jgi:hypothetical protein